MEQYFGTKQINAKPMTRGEYNIFRGWDIPKDESPKDEGYLVEYIDGVANTDIYKGYVSWSPKKVFEKAYQPVNAMSFGHAIKALKEGAKVARAGWNGKDMFIFLVQGSTFKVNRPPLLGIYEEDTEIKYHAHIDMRTADGQIVPWVASQSDLLSNDWMLVAA